MYIVENLGINGTRLSADAAAAATTITVDTPGNLSAGAATIWDMDSPVGEAVTISGIVGSTVTLSAGLGTAYTIMAQAHITMTAGIPATGVVKEFDLKINSLWTKICYIKIVQMNPGAMNVTFDIFEKSEIDESIRRNLVYNVLKRNIEMTAVQGAQYGESLTDHPIPYKDRDAIDEERTYNLHCRLSNEPGGTPSDFEVSIKLADIGEGVG
uniref:Tail protein n=1 Tax=viral metagenome TaxID=1070528 RepID=A0A6M3MG54_9ZZZZ